MANLRSASQRKADVLSVLTKNGDAWLATASPDGRPQLIAVSVWWDGESATIATRMGSVTARNIDRMRMARLGFGSPDDVIMIDATLRDRTAVTDAQLELRSGFTRAVGWDPAEEGDDWAFFRLRPLRIQAYRGYGELEGRELMRDARWLA